jgi:hypothetical protein
LGIAEASRLSNRSSYQYPPDASNASPKWMMLEYSFPGTIEQIAAARGTAASARAQSRAVTRKNRSASSVRAVAFSNISNNI